MNTEKITLAQAKKLGFKKGALVKDKYGIYKILDKLKYFEHPTNDVCAHCKNINTEKLIYNGILIRDGKPKVKLVKQNKMKIKKKKKRVPYKQGGVKIIKTRSSGLLHPRTRMQEVLCLMLEAVQSLTYVEMCDALDNVNCHKAVQYWKQRGVVFADPKHHRQNRFGRMGHFKRFSVKNRAKARKAYRKNVMREE